MRMDEIRKKAEELIEKRSWLRKGLAELLEEMNKAVGELPESDEEPIEAVLVESKEEKWGETKLAKLVLVFDPQREKPFCIKRMEKEGATIAIDELEWRGYVVNVNALSPDEIRAIAGNLPRAVEEIENRMSAMIESRDEAIKKIEALTVAVRMAAV